MIKISRKGIGKQAIHLVIDEIRRNNNANISIIMIGYAPENLTAKFVYKKQDLLKLNYPLGVNS